jgi:dTDP-4-dehydrorhamnose reductase
VVNAAAYTAVDRAEQESDLARRVNADAAGEIAGAAAAIGAPLIHLSTDYVFGGTGTKPMSEDQPIAPLGTYGRTKAEAEARVREEQPDHLILRTAWVYSPFGSNFVRTMLRLAGEREEIGVVADQLGSPSSALDLAEVILALARAPAGRRRFGLGRHLPRGGDRRRQLGGRGRGSDACKRRTGPHPPHRHQ